MYTPPAPHKPLGYKPEYRSKNYNKSSRHADYYKSNDYKPSGYKPEYKSNDYMKPSGYTEVYNEYQSPAYELNYGELKNKSDLCLRAR